MESLVAAHPAVPDYRHLLARCYREIPPLRFARGSKLATDAANKAATILQKLVEEYPDVPDYRYDLSETYAILAFSPDAMDQTAKRRSQEMLEKALAISEELVAEHPNIPDYAVSQVHMRLGLTDLLREGDQSRAEASLRKALDLQSTLVRRFPRNSSYKFWMAIIHESLAGFLLERGQLAETRSALQDSIALLKEAMHDDPKARHIRDVLAGNYMNLADVLRRMNEDQAAADAIRQAHDLQPGQ